MIHIYTASMHITIIHLWRGRVVYIKQARFWKKIEWNGKISGAMFLEYISILLIPCCVAVNCVMDWKCSIWLWNYMTVQRSDGAFSESELIFTLHLVVYYPMLNFLFHSTPNPKHVLIFTILLPLLNLSAVIWHRFCVVHVFVCSTDKTTHPKFYFLWFLLLLLLTGWTLFMWFQICLFHCFILELSINSPRTFVDVDVQVSSSYSIFRMNWST